MPFTNNAVLYDNGDKASIHRSQRADTALAALPAGTLTAGDHEGTKAARAATPRPAVALPLPAPYAHGTQSPAAGRPGQGNTRPDTAHRHRSASAEGSPGHPDPPLRPGTRGRGSAGRGLPRTPRGEARRPGRLHAATHPGRAPLLFSSPSSSSGRAGPLAPPGGSRGETMGAMTSPGSNARSRRRPPPRDAPLPPLPGRSSPGPRPSGLGPPPTGGPGSEPPLHLPLRHARGGGCRPRQEARGEADSRYGAPRSPRPHPRYLRGGGGRAGEKEREGGSGAAPPAGSGPTQEAAVCVCERERERVCSTEGRRCPRRRRPRPRRFPDALSSAARRRPRPPPAAVGAGPARSGAASWVGTEGRRAEGWAVVVALGAPCPPGRPAWAGCGAASSCAMGSALGRCRSAGRRVER